MHVDNRGGERMFFKKGEFLKLENGTVLEVVFADDEKAICLKIQKSKIIGWLYTGKSIVISNNSSDYTEPLGFEMIPSIGTIGKYRWEPLKPTITFPMV